MSGKNESEADILNRAYQYQHPRNVQKETQQQQHDRLRTAEGRYMSRMPDGSADSPPVGPVTEDQAEADLQREIAKLG